MEISIETENCDLNKFYHIEGNASSIVKLMLTMPNIISSQSRNASIKKLIYSMHEKLSNFKWIIIGEIKIEYIWYLNAIERQETDKIGDLDNILKPVQDSLTGPNGIIIDDSQISSIQTYWQNRNTLFSNNILNINIKFNNDFVLYKQNLQFIQYYKAICLPINLDKNDIKNVIVAKILIRSKLKHRKIAEKIKSLGYDIDNYFVCSNYDFHKTRLSKFSVIKIEELNIISNELGITIKHYLEIIKSKSYTINNEK